MTMKILSEHYKNLVGYGLCKGLLKENSVYDLSDSLYVSKSQYLDLLSDLIVASKDPQFGLHFGFFLNIKALKSVYEISMVSTSIEQIVQLWADYSDTNFPLVQFDSYLEGDYFFLELNSPLTTSMRNVILDTIFVFVFRELKLMVGSEKFDCYVPNKNPKEFSYWFKQLVVKGKKHCFRFHVNTLQIKLNTNQKKDMESILPKFLSMVSLPNSHYQPFSAKVRLMTLHMCEPELPSLSQVATQFAMTPRTLQRRLKQESSSFRQITNDIKKELFYYLKLGKTLKTQEIAWLLGFSSSSALLHAKQNWELVS